jgi:hypothetical protein
MNLVATVFAFITFAVLHAVVSRGGDTALRANLHTAVGTLEHVIETGVAVGKLRVEVVY